MASQQELLNEALRRGLIKADSPYYQEAVKRGLIQQPQSTGMMDGLTSEGPSGLGQLIPGDAPSRTERFNRGLSDTPLGAAQLAVNAGYVPSFPGSYGSKKAQELYSQLNNLNPEEVAAQANQDIAANEREYQARRGPDAGVDWMRVLGNIASSAPTMLIAPESVGASVLRTATYSGVQSGLASALQPITKEGDYWAQKGQQTAIGTAAGFGTGGAIAGISKALTPSVSEGAQYLADRGVRLTPGQMTGQTASSIEQRLTGVVPFVGDARRRAVEDFNKAALNEALSPLGKTVDKVGRAGIKQARQTISQAYDDVLNQITFRADDVFQSELSNLESLASNLNKSQADDFARIIKTEVKDKLGETGIVDGQTFKGIESVLNSAAKKNLRSANYNENQLGNALQEALSSLRGALSRSNPQAAETLSKVNQSRAIFETVRTASTGKGVRGGIFTPDRLMNAVARTDKSKGQRVMSEGGYQLQKLAETGQEILGNTIPNSGTPERLVTQAAVTGGLGFIDPTLAATVGGASLLYTQPGQRFAQSLLTGARPTWLRGASGLMARSAIPVGTGVGLLAGSQ